MSTKICWDTTDVLLGLPCKEGDAEEAQSSDSSQGVSTKDTATTSVQLTSSAPPPATEPTTSSTQSTSTTTHAATISTTSTTPALQTPISKPTWKKETRTTTRVLFSSSTPTVNMPDTSPTNTWSPTGTTSNTPILDAVSQTLSEVTVNSSEAPEPTAAPLQQSSTLSQDDNQTIKTLADITTHAAAEHNSASFSLQVVPSASSLGQDKTDSSSSKFSPLKAVIPVVAVAAVAAILIIWLACKRCIPFAGKDDLAGIDAYDPDFYAIDSDKAKTEDASLHDEDLYQPPYSTPPPAKQLQYNPPEVHYNQHPPTSQPVYSQPQYAPQRPASSYYQSTTYPEDSASFAVGIPPVPPVPDYVFADSKGGTSSTRGHSERTSHFGPNSSYMGEPSTSFKRHTTSISKHTNSSPCHHASRQSVLTNGRFLSAPSSAGSERPVTVSNGPQVRFAGSPVPSPPVPESSYGGYGSGSSFHGIDDNATLASQPIMLQEAKPWDAEVSSVYSK